MAKLRMLDAIRAAIREEMLRDERVFCIGEDIGIPGGWGGAFTVTLGLEQEFPDRMVNTPISEATICGSAVGAAMVGVRPVVELMYMDFALMASDQLFNQIGQLGHIYGGHVSVPLVCRTRIAAGLGYGAQHSMDPVALFALFPGWRILVPTTPFDVIGLFNAAMKLKSPTLIVEHQGFSGETGMIPDSAENAIRMDF